MAFLTTVEAETTNHESRSTQYRDSRITERDVSASGGW